MLSNAYFHAKFRFDTAENEPSKNLQNFAIFPNFANPHGYRSAGVRPVAGESGVTGESGEAGEAGESGETGDGGSSRMSGTLSLGRICSKLNF